MSDLQNLIKRIQVSSDRTKSYVYYDSDNGKIYKISSKNIPDEEYKIFPIDTNEVQSILTGERRTDEYAIFYDVSVKEIRLKEVAYDDSHRTADTMCYQLPVIKHTHDEHFSIEKVYDGVDIYMYNDNHSYSKNQCVWFKDNVYKLKTDLVPSEVFDKDEHILFVEDVLITSLPTQTHSAEKLTMIPEYVGIHVDVWYKELSHLSGQHVWINGVVYRLLEDQPAYTEFTMDNAEIVVSNVKLYSDANKKLPVVKTITPGDVVLNDNSIYSIQLVMQDFSKDKTSIFFYSNPTTLLYYVDDMCAEVDLVDLTEKITYRDIQLDLHMPVNLKNGQIILSGKQLHQVQVDKEYDIIIQQNTFGNYWSILLNPHTKKFLLTSGYKPTEVLYFSVTSKYDPNVLFRSLEFTVGELLSDSLTAIPFIFESESSDTDVSIYTAKYFESYAHEII